MTINPLGLDRPDLIEWRMEVLRECRVQVQILEPIVEAAEEGDAIEESTERVFAYVCDKLRRSIAPGAPFSSTVRQFLEAEASEAIRAVISEVDVREQKNV